SPADRSRVSPLADPERANLAEGHRRRLRRDELGLERVVTRRLRASTCNGGGAARLAQRACRNHGDCRQHLAASLDGRAVLSRCIAVSLYELDYPTNKNK